MEHVLTIENVPDRRTKNKVLELQKERERKIAYSLEKEGNSNWVTTGFPKRGNFKTWLRNSGS